MLNTFSSPSTHTHQLEHLMLNYQLHTGSAGFTFDLASFCTETTNKRSLTDTLASKLTSRIITGFNINCASDRRQEKPCEIYMKKQLLSRIRLFLAVTKHDSKCNVYVLFGFKHSWYFYPQILRLANRADERQRIKPAHKGSRDDCPPITMKSRQAHSMPGQSGKTKGAGQILLMAVCPRLLAEALA